MATFPVRYSERAPSGEGPSVPMRLNTDTGAGDVFSALAGMGGKLAALGAQLKAADEVVKTSKEKLAIDQRADLFLTTAEETPDPEARNTLLAEAEKGLGAVASTDRSKLYLNDVLANLRGANMKLSLRFKRKEAEDTFDTLLPQLQAKADVEGYKKLIGGAASTGLITAARGQQLLSDMPFDFELAGATMDAQTDPEKALSRIEALKPSTPEKAKALDATRAHFRELASLAKRQAKFDDDKADSELTAAATSLIGKSPVEIAAGVEAIRKDPRMAMLSGPTQRALSGFLDSVAKPEPSKPDAEIEAQAWHLANTKDPKARQFAKDNIGKMSRETFVAVNKHLDETEDKPVDNAKVAGIAQAEVDGLIQGAEEKALFNATITPKINALEPKDRVPEKVRSLIAQEAEAFGQAQLFKRTEKLTEGQKKVIGEIALNKHSVMEEDEYGTKKKVERPFKGSEEARKYLIAEMGPEWAKSRLAVETYQNTFPGGKLTQREEKDAKTWGYLTINEGIKKAMEVIWKDYRSRSAATQPTSEKRPGKPAAAAGATTQKAATMPEYERAKPEPRPGGEPTPVDMSRVPTTAPVSDLARMFHTGPVKVSDVYPPGITPGGKKEADFAGMRVLDALKAQGLDERAGRGFWQTFGEHFWKAATAPGEHPKSQHWDDPYWAKAEIEAQDAKMRQDAGAPVTAAQRMAAAAGGAGPGLVKFMVALAVAKRMTSVPGLEPGKLGQYAAGVANFTLAEVLLGGEAEQGLKTGTAFETAGAVATLVPGPPWAKKIASMIAAGTAGAGTTLAQGGSAEDATVMALLPFAMAAVGRAAKGNPEARVKKAAEMWNVPVEQARAIIGYWDAGNYEGWKAAQRPVEPVEAKAEVSARGKTAAELDAMIAAGGVNPAEARPKPPEAAPQGAGAAVSPAPAPEPARAAGGAEAYPERPYGEDAIGFQKRVAGRNPWQVTQADFRRGAAYEYLADGERRSNLLKMGLGTAEERDAYHKKSVQDAVAQGLPVPDAVLADYPDLKQPPPPVRAGEGATPAPAPKPEPVATRTEPTNEPGYFYHGTSKLKVADILRRGLESRMRLRNDFGELRGENYDSPQEQELLYVNRKYSGEWGGKGKGNIQLRFAEDSAGKAEVGEDVLRRGEFYLTHEEGVRIDPADIEFWDTKSGAWRPLTEYGKRPAPTPAPAAPPAPEAKGREYSLPERKAILDEARALGLDTSGKTGEVAARVAAAKKPDTFTEGTRETPTAPGAVSLGAKVLPRGGNLDRLPPEKRIVIERKQPGLGLIDRGVHSLQYLGRKFGGLFGKAADTVELNEFRMVKESGDQHYAVEQATKGLPGEWKAKAKGGELMKLAESVNSDAEVDALNVPRPVKDWIKTGKGILGEHREYLRGEARETSLAQMRGWNKDRLAAALADEGIGLGDKWTNDQARTALADKNAAEWGKGYSYMPHQFRGEYRLSADVGDQNVFVGRAQTPNEAFLKLDQFRHQNPTATNFQAAVDQSYAGADMTRLSRKQTLKLRSDIAANAKIAEQAVVDAMSGKIGMREFRQKFFGGKLKRAGAEGYETDADAVMHTAIAQFNRHKWLSKMNREVQPMIEELKRGGATDRDLAKHLEGTLEYLWGKPSVQTKAVDAVLAKIGLGNYLKPFWLDRNVGRLTTLQYYGKLMNPRFAVVNRLQPMQTVDAVLGIGTSELVGLKMRGGYGKDILAKYLPAFASKYEGSAAGGRWSGEMRNQAVAFMSFFEHGTKQGMTEAQAVNYGLLNGVLRTQFYPLRSDTSVLMRSPIGKLLFQFRRFGVKNVELAQTLGRDRNYSGLVRMVGTSAALGGLALFLRSDWANLIGDVNQKKIKDALEEQFGKMAANGMMYGLPGLVGADISGSINVLDVPVGSDSAVEKGARMLAGPTLGDAAAYWGALTDTKAPEPSAALRLYDTAATKNSSLRFIDEGLRTILGREYDTPRGQRRWKEEPGIVTRLMRAAALRTTWESDQSLQTAALIEFDQQWNSTLDAAVQEKDPAKRAAIVERWNILWPNAKMSPSNVIHRERGRQKEADKPQTARLGSKRARQTLLGSQLEED